MIRPRRRPDRPAEAPAPDDRRKRWAGFLNKGAGLAVIALLVVLTDLSGVLRPVDDGLARLRFDVLQRPASDTLTVVEIDAASIRAAGRWPWGRERFATAIDKLQAAGAEVVAFDVDFSARSSPEADRALRAAIERRPGGVVLPTFVQPMKEGDEERLVETSPLGALSAEAVLASVNVPVDSDGRVRRYHHGFGGENGYRQTVAGLLAGAPYGRTGSFLIDYGVRPADIDRLTFQDVHDGRFDPELVRGRKVLIGSTALELGDRFATPKLGTVPGVYVHALAYESLKAGRGLVQLHPLAALAIACWVAWLLRPRDTLDLTRAMRRHLAVAGGLVLAPLAVQALAPVSLDASPVMMAQLLALIWVTRTELTRRAEAIVREREAGLLHLALHEPETELPNRRALLRALGERLAEPGAGPTAVIAIGIDRFSTMRGAIGYRRFNEVMRQVAGRIAETSGEAMVAHLSTSVLGLVVSAPTAPALRATVRKLEGLDPSIEIDGELPVDAFVRLGVAYRRQDDDTAESLLENASVALDRARDLDRRAVAFDRKAFADPSLNLALMSDMRRALAAGEMRLHYQPKVSTRTGEVLGVEALVRWSHPTRGPIRPDVLVATAEETGMIRALTDWGVAQAVADLKRLGALGHGITVAVNISAGLLADREFKRKLIRSAEGCGGRLCLEITESAIIQSPDEALAAIAEFRAAGLKISIDDYGTGLSSLSYLKLIEADELKLDKSLVTAVAESARDRLILKSTVELAHGLGMSVVAEGVETPQVMAALAAMGCDVAQGFLVSRPLAVEDLADFLAAPADARARRARAAAA